MNCDFCKSETAIERNQRYHYTECGLDNVYLENVDVRICSSCGERSPIIPRIIELHATIGQAIALQNVPLAGKESRFSATAFRFESKWDLLSPKGANCERPVHHTG